MGGPDRPGRPETILAREYCSGHRGTMARRIRTYRSRRADTRRDRNLHLWRESTHSDCTLGTRVRVERTTTAQSSPSDVEDRNMRREVKDVVPAHGRARQQVM